MSYGTGYQETLHPGILIESKINPGGGTLGCFARLASDATKVVLLSNSHVLYGPARSLGASGNDSKVGQPSVSCCLCCTCRVIGRNLEAAFNWVEVNVTSPAAIAGSHEGSEIDCAIVLLNDKRPYTNSTLYGMITGTPAGLGVAGGDPVEMVGSRSGHMKGRVLRFNTNATRAGGGSVPDVQLPFPLEGTEIEEGFAGVMPSINQMLIVADADPNDPARPMHFCSHGDSGSVLVNGAREAVGIISKAWEIGDASRGFLNQLLHDPLPAHAGTLGIASPIAPVLTALGIVIANNMAGTAPSAGESPEALEWAASEREQERAFQATLRELESEVRARSLGAATMAALDRHRGEVLRLVNTQRHVAATWRRNRGPAFAAHCTHSIRDHDYVIPDCVDGVSPRALLERMAVVLRRYGSVQLRADIDAYEGLALEWVEGCTSIWQLVERLRQLERAADCDGAGAVDGAAFEPRRRGGVAAR